MNVTTYFMAYELRYSDSVATVTNKYDCLKEFVGGERAFDAYRIMSDEACSDIKKLNPSMNIQLTVTQFNRVD